VQRLADGTPRLTAKSPATPGVWSHFAVTRDAAGLLRLFVDGELQATTTAAFVSTPAPLQAGPLADIAGWLGELRLWRVARNANNVRQGFDLTWGNVPPAARPKELAAILAAAEWPTDAAPRVQAAPEYPALLTPAEAVARDERFAQFRRLARARGEPSSGRTLFTGLCLTCHSLAGKGGTLAPPLDGIGHSDTEALLRHILTPNAAMESAYRTYRVVTREQEVIEGFLTGETADAVVLRLPGAADRRIPRRSITQSGYLARSLMPEGLLDALPPQQVSDLFTYLRTLQ
jgi:putative heme-binding domain-containing protein